MKKSILVISVLTAAVFMFTGCIDANTDAKADTAVIENSESYELDKLSEFEELEELEFLLELEELEKLIDELDELEE